MIERSLIVKTDSYTGNTDSFLLGALFGVSDGRHGGKFGVELHKELFGDLEPEFYSMIFEDINTHRSHEDYGMVRYRIYDDNDRYNSIEFFIDDYVETDWFQKFVDVVRERTGGFLQKKTNTLGYDTAIEIKLLGFKMLERVTTSTLTEL